MMRFFLWCLLVLLLGCQPATQVGQVRPDQLDFPKLKLNFPEVSQQQLDNGMKVYLMEDHELPLVDLTLMVGGGSIEDPLAKTGLSDVFAATLETGGAGELSPKEVEAELEAMGAELEVANSTYYTSIHLSVHRQDLPRGLEILADLLRRPRFDQVRFELARDQLLQKIHRQNDEPGPLAARLLSEAIFPDHPFGNSPQVDAVERFNRDDLLALQQSLLQPSNIWVAVSGAVEQPRLLALMQDNFADWSSQQSVDSSLPQLPPAPDGRILVVDKKIPQTVIMLGHSGISKSNPDQYALRVADYILGSGGFNSRMMREIRSNRGLAYSVYAYFKVGRRLPELFIARSETKCESTVEVVSLMRELMTEIRQEPITQAELELAKKSLINSFVFAFSNAHSIVTRKVRLDFFDYPDNYLENYRDNIAAVTIDDVQRVAHQYLRPDRLQIVLVGNTELFSADLDGFDLPIERVDL